MSSSVIKVENISKQYRLGEIGTGSLSHDLNRWWHSVRGKEDPYLKIGDVNDRTQLGNSEYVWSLRDINFEIKQGEAVGIIGRNGAGKSTLLKILSRVTMPTTGSMKIKGRVASLLEVGTGFHPDLSGRENIFLNGAILGMRKEEIKKKFDEIVDFAGVERYIDTPVKRYSSGMYVRLAFGVAAHLESEILIVDEVLAVGDAEFQKKCLGKMNDVSKGDGRTVIFVSHNMASISTLCTNGIYLKHGQLISTGDVGNIISEYLGDGAKATETSWSGVSGNDNVKIYKTIVYPADEKDGFHTNTDIFVEIHGEVLKPVYGLIVGFNLSSQFDYEIAYVTHDDDADDIEIKEIAPGKFIKTFRIPANTLAEGTYSINFDVGIHNVERIIEKECDITFSLINISGLGRKYLNGATKGRVSLIRSKWGI